MSMTEATEVAREAGNADASPKGVKRPWPWFAAALAMVAVLASAAAFVTRDGREELSPREALAAMRRNAREREIAKMIETLREVDAATVLIKESEDDCGASVTLTMRAPRTSPPLAETIWSLFTTKSLICVCEERKVPA